MNRNTILIILILLVITGVGGYFGYKAYWVNKAYKKALDQGLAPKKSSLWKTDVQMLKHIAENGFGT